MKKKIKRHSRSALSVLLSLCMLVSCITVGMIGTDAAQTLDAVGASADEASVGAEADEASVGAAVDDGESVGDPSSVTIGYDWDGSWKTKSLSKDTAWEVTFSTAKTIQFYFQDGSTYYKYDSSQQMPYDSTNQNEFRGHKNGTSNLSFSAKAATYVVMYTGTNNNDLLYFKFYRKQSTYSITKTTDGNGTLSGASSAAKDDSVTLTANPDRGYQFASATVKDSSGQTVSSTTSGNNITFTMPDKAVTANATFTTATSRTVEASHVTVGQGTIKLTLKSGSTVVGSESADNNLDASLTAYDGETLTVTTSPSAGYKLTKITINGTDYTSAQTITISGNVTVSAEFEKGAALANDYTATLGSSITGNSNLFSNIKATFFDYYTDNEITGGWYTGINAETDGWIGGVSNRNPYTKLNSALSEYASTNSIQYPMYFCAEYYKDNNQGSDYYHDPGYYHSSSADKGNLINDSNALGGSNKALPGLAGSSLTNGMINYAAYSGSTYNGNGAPMVLFDKQWLSSRGNDPDPDKLKLKYNSTYNWSSGTPNVYVGFRDTWPHEYWIKMELDSTNQYYKASIPSGWENKNVVFARMQPGVTLTTGEINNTTTAQANWDKLDSSTYTQQKTGTGMSRDGMTYVLSSWTSGSWDNTYSGPLASFVNSGFPVRKTTHDGATYYEFNSENATDNVYFDNLTSGSPVIQYGAGTTYGQKNGYNGGYGFFPFDRYDVRKRTDVSWNTYEYGKDLALGMKLEIKFTLGHDTDGKLGWILNEAGNAYVQQKFDFSGDDDLWVYVDDNLILDLGGDHSKTVGQINFASNSATTYQGTVSVNTNTSLTSATNQSFTIDTNKKVHTMTIYYMERGMHESNLKFGFSMSPLENEFSVENEVDTTGLNAGLVSQYTDTFTVTNTSYDSDGTTENDHSKSKEYDYYKWNSSTSKYVKDGTGTSGSSGEFNLTSNPTKQYADFNNKLTVGDVLNVVEASQKGYQYDTTYQLLDEEYLVDGQPDLIKQGNGATTGKFTFKTALPNSDPNIDVTNLRVKYNNVLKTQTLDVTKALQDGYASPDRFTVQLGLVMKNGSTVTQTFNTAGLVYTSSEDGFLEEYTLDANGRTTISRGETIRFEGIPEGAVATVTEIDKPGYAFVSMGHSASSNTYSTSTKSATVTLNNHDVVTITNEKLHDLTISKEVTGGASSAYFPVVVKKYSGGSYVQITSSNYNTYSYDVATVKTQSNYDADDDDWYFDTDKNRFMVKAGKSFTIKGSSTGDKFTVAEYTGDISGYTYSGTTVSPASSETELDGSGNLEGYENITFATDDINVNISNAVYVQPTYNLTVTKTVTVGTPTANTYFPIYVQYKYAGGGSYQQIVDGQYGSLVGFFSDPETISYSSTGSPDWYFDGTKDCFMLKAGESFTLSGCNNGDQFIVAEDKGNITGYTYKSTTASNGTGTVYTSGNYEGLQDITIGDSDVTVTVKNANEAKATIRVKYAPSYYDFQQGTNITQDEYKKDGSVYNHISQNVLCVTDFTDEASSTTVINQYTTEETATKDATKTFDVRVTSVNDGGYLFIGWYDGDGNRYNNTDATQHSFTASAPKDMDRIFEARFITQPTYRIDYDTPTRLWGSRIYKVFGKVDNSMITNGYIGYDSSRETTASVEKRYYLTGDLVEAKKPSETIFLKNITWPNIDNGKASTEYNKSKTVTSNTDTSKNVETVTGTVTYDLYRSVAASVSDRRVTVDFYNDCSDPDTLVSQWEGNYGDTIANNNTYATNIPAGKTFYRWRIETLNSLGGTALTENGVLVTYDYSKNFNYVAYDNYKVTAEVIDKIGDSDFNPNSASNSKDPYHAYAPTNVSTVVNLGQTRSHWNDTEDGTVYVPDEGESTNYTNANYNYDRMFIDLALSYSDGSETKLNESGLDVGFIVQYKQGDNWVDWKTVTFSSSLLGDKNRIEYYYGFQNATGNRNAKFRVQPIIAGVASGAPVEFDFSASQFSAQTNY